MLIDDVTIRIQAGKGGDGKVAFNSNLKSLGPVGGSGGDGGSVYLEGISDLAGLGKTHPMLGLAVAVFMFSMAGIPPLAGFIGKFSECLPRNVN